MPSNQNQEEIEPVSDPFGFLFDALDPTQQLLYEKALVEMDATGDDAGAGLNAPWFRALAGVVGLTANR